jgi:hypothetical protein
MARPRKQDADYFPHDKDMRNDPKVRALRQKYGLEGYAVWCMLIETVCDADGFCIELDELQAELMAGDFGIEVGKLGEYLVYFRRLKLITQDGLTIQIPALNARLRPLLENRARKRGWAAENSGVLDVQNPNDVPITDVESAQSKVKDINSIYIPSNTVIINSDEAQKNEPNHAENFKRQVSEWLDEVYADTFIQEAFSMSRKVPAEKFTEYCTRFRSEALGKAETYHKRADVVSHFLNWSGSRHQMEISPTNGNGYQRRPARRGDVQHYDNGRTIEEKQAF